MNTLRHPVFAFSVVGAPFVLYSIPRAGGFAHLADVRLLGTVYVWPIILLAGILIAMSVLYSKGHGRMPLLGAILAATVFLGCQFLSEYPLDYKLWVYVVAPTFVWCLLLSLPVAAFLALLARSEKMEPRNR